MSDTALEHLCGAPSVNEVQLDALTCQREESGGSPVGDDRRSIVAEELRRLAFRQAPRDRPSPTKTAREARGPELETAARIDGGESSGSAPALLGDKRAGGPEVGPPSAGLRNRVCYPPGHWLLSLTVQGVPVFLKWVELPGDFGLLPETAPAPAMGPAVIPTATAPVAMNRQIRRLMTHLPPVGGWELGPSFTAKHPANRAESDGVMQVGTAPAFSRL
jgi:hypothetical protein